MAVCAVNIANFSPNPFDPTAPNTITVQKISSLTKDIIKNHGTLPNTPGSSVTITLENFNNISATNYTADLAVTLDRGPNAVGGRIVKRAIPLDLISSGSSPTVTIVGCSSTPSNGGPLSQNDVCALFGGSYDSTQGKCIGTGGGGTACPGMPLACGNGVTYTMPSQGSGSYYYSGPVIANGSSHFCDVRAICSATFVWSSPYCACN